MHEEGELITDSGAEHRHRGAFTIQEAKSAGSQTPLGLISTIATLLFVNGQSTERTVLAVQRVAHTIGIRATAFPRWDELTIQVDDDSGSHHNIVAASPTGVDMHKVVATTDVIDQFCGGLIDAAAAQSALESITRFPPVSTARFALTAAAGAAALAVIFGAAHLLSVIIIAFSAGAGACLRRWLARQSRNLFVQPLCAALLAGIIGAVFVRMHSSSVLRLVAVCPCMVLVPGPHFLNGAIDMARGRIGLGAVRVGYASLTTAVICAGLLVGLALGGVSLPPSGPSRFVPVGYDVIAAGVAVAAYGTFFAMPWRMLPVPIVVGMLAHASRWVAISVVGTGVVTGAFVACLLVGIIMTPIADRLRLPFAGLAFASVVALIPGVFLFRMAGGLVELVTLGTKAPQDIVVEVLADAATAILIILAMGAGLIIPKLCIEHFGRALPVGE